MIRETVEIPDEASDPLQLGYYYDLSDSFLKEIISMLDHVNPLFKSDNTFVYSIMKEAARGTVYAMTINPYIQKNNGIYAFKVMVSSYACQDKWKQLQK